MYFSFQNSELSLKRITMHLQVQTNDQILNDSSRWCHSNIWQCNHLFVAYVASKYWQVACKNSNEKDISNMILLMKKWDWYDFHV